MSVSTAAADQSICAPLPVLGADVTVPLVTGGEVTYAALDYAASAPALQRVWDDVAAYAPYYGSVHRGAGYLSQLSTDLFESSRVTVAEFLGCRAEDQVVFTRSTTDSLNLLAAALPANCQVFVFETEHHASLLPWRDARVTCLDAPRTPAEAVVTLGRALADRDPYGPALVCVTGASNVTGELWPVRELAAAAHAHGARIVLDAAQLAPTTRWTSRNWTSTGSPSPGTSCTRRSARASSRAGPTGCGTRSRISRAAAPPGRSPGAPTAEWTWSGTPRLPGTRPDRPT